MKKLTLFTGLMMLGLLTYAQGTWNIDKTHSNVSFSVEHLVISEVTGKFGSFEGEIVSTSEDFIGSTVNFTIDANSVDTDNDRRDGHLKGDDFFGAKEYPKITFKGKSLEQVDGKKYKLKGDLTIRDVTKSVELDVKYGGTITDHNPLCYRKWTGAVTAINGPNAAYSMGIWEQPRDGCHRHGIGREHRR